MKDPWKGWWITWPLSQQVRVGDVFDTAGGKQRTAGDLAQRTVRFDAAPGVPPGSFTYDSKGTVSVRFKVAGSIPQGFSALAEMETGALVEFAGASSVLVIYDGLAQEGFSDTRSVAADLTRLYWDGKWDTELVAVSDVVTAAAGTVLTATQRGASAELRAKASGGVGPVSLVDLAGNVAFARSAHLGLHWVGSGFTPFYRVVRLRKTWLDQLKTEYGPRQPGRGAAPDPVPPIVLEEARENPVTVLEGAQTDEQPPDAENGASEVAPSSGPRP